jgi:YjbE family integral membrane protein
LDFGATLSVIWASIELAALNLLLGADNAVLVALACQPLPLELRKPVLVIGLGGAILLRFGLAALASALLAVPGLRLAAAVFLLWVAVGLLSDRKSPGGGALAESDAISPPPAIGRSWETVLIVVVADVVMSLDNVVALVSVSQGNLTLLVFGLLLSVPALVYGAFVLTKVFDDWPNLILLGAVLLGWIAGQLAATDELISAWVLRQAPALTVVLPALCACYVYFVGRPRLRGDLR